MTATTVLFHRESPFIYLRYISAFKDYSARTVRAYQSESRYFLAAGVSAKIKDLQDGMKQYQVVIESGGKVIPGGYTPYAMAAKQVWDNEVAPGRRWAVDGMGANVRTIETPSPGGGCGKPMKMYLTPIVTFGFGIMRGYSPANHQPYSSNAGWINPG